MKEATLKWTSSATRAPVERGWYVVMKTGVSSPTMLRYYGVSCDCDKIDNTSRSAAWERVTAWYGPVPLSPV